MFEASKLAQKRLQAAKKEFKKSPHPRSIETIKALAVFRGSQSGLKYAESFNLIRSIKKN